MPHQVEKMASSASAYQFNPHDLRYYQCCCCARLHIAALAKAIAVICIVTNVVNIWAVIMGVGGIGFVLGAVIGSGIMAVAVFQEHRPTLILLLVIQGLGMAASVVLLFLIFLAVFFLKVTMPQQKLNDYNKIGLLFYVYLAFSMALMFWSFAVMLQFYTYLTDRERAGAVQVMYEARMQREHPQQPRQQQQQTHQQQQQQQQQHQQENAGPGPYRNENRKGSLRPSSHDSHISYPIYNVHRTPSLTPAPSPVPSAPPALVIAVSDHHLPPPPSYDIVHIDEKKKVDKEDDAHERHPLYENSEDREERNGGKVTPPSPV